MTSPHRRLQPSFACTHAFGSVYAGCVFCLVLIPSTTTTSGLVGLNPTTRNNQGRKPRRYYYDNIMAFPGVLKRELRARHYITGRAKQRASIARATVREPKILILDETQSRLLLTQKPKTPSRKQHEARAQNRTSAGISAPRVIRPNWLTKLFVAG